MQYPPRKDPMESTGKTDTPFWKRLTGWALLAACVLCLAEVAALIVVGGAWTWHGLHATRPAPRLLAAFCAWLAWYVLRHAGRHTRAEWGRFAGRLTLAAFSTALALLTAEIALRIFLERAQKAQSLDQLGTKANRLTKEKIRTSHPLAAIIQKSRFNNLVYELKPGLTMEFGHCRLRTNAAGMRKSRDYTVGKPAGTIRIVGLGDSGMFGWNVHQDENYLDVLESNLNARAAGTVYETLNFGVPGYNTQLEVETLKAKGLAYKPDIVVVGWCDNDFGLPFFIPQEGQWGRKDVSFLYNLLFDRKAFADLALNQINDQRQYDENRIPEHFRAGSDVSGVRNQFAILKELGREHGFRIIVIGPMQKEAVEIFKELEIIHFNTVERINAADYPPEFYVHSFHPRAGGHRVLAEQLEREMRERNWL